MKTAIAYPPVAASKGVPLLSQNRQFQWFNRPTYIYPVVPACAATMLKQAGHEVVWLDGIAAGWTTEEFFERVAAAAPEIMLIEAKTPVIKAYWRIIDRLKETFTDLRVALCGDHVTALPRESLEHCRVDYVLTGGDYDFLFRDLAASLDCGAQLPPGVHYRDGDAISDSGTFATDNDLNALPFIDRELTFWELYSRDNGNFRNLPGTYTMAGRDCWWGKCRFCSWTTLYPNWRVQTPERFLDEIGHILDRYPVREIFDDTGCFPTGNWLRRFCRGMLERGYHQRVVLGCNMIPGVLTREHYELMAAAGFRFVLFGLESADQTTLDRIRKCGRAAEIEGSMRMAKAAGLEPHVTCMVGYPWETGAQARSTIAMTRRLFETGCIDSLQATIVIPYPGTPLFDECRGNGWLLTEDWDRYDMREPVMKTEMPAEEIMALTRGIYKSFLTPRFIWLKLKNIRSWNDVVYYARLARRVLGHLVDFKA